MTAADASGWHTPVPVSHPAHDWLSAAAVRSHCEAVFASVENGDSPHFIWRGAELDTVARYVADTIRLRYPDLKVPYHSRWRHFEAGGMDRFGELARMHHLSGDELARVSIDLVIPSVLLDAGAGPDWQFSDRATDGSVRQSLARSEGLGVASLAMFASGAFSEDMHAPLRSDAGALACVTPEQIAEAFQVSAQNSMVGLEGRAALIRRLGEVAAATPTVFGHPTRLGNLFDYLRERAAGGKIPAALILATLLRALGPVWPGRIALEGVSLGDCWPHPASPGGLVAFHKLTQWLTYSLFEPLEQAGLEIIDADALTGLPEYRNGGLLLDLELLVPRDPELFHRTLQVDDEVVVEWRAVTVAALDRIAVAVRAELGLGANDFPLARVLEGGTWAAGRRIAAERRPGGGPPLKIASDGTVF